MLPASYLIIAQSGRALAASATRGNYPIHVMDCFADMDTCAEALSVEQVPFTDHCFDKDFLTNAIKKRCLEQPGMQLVPGSGFERKPALLRTLSDLAPCIGNPADVVHKVKDPDCFFGLLDELGIPHPLTTTRYRNTGHNWLCKMTGGMGGDHIVRLDKNKALPGSRVYFQQCIEGESCSALFLADGKRAQVLGFSKLWHADDFIETPFKYGGAISLAAPAEAFNKWMSDVINKLVVTTGLKGLCGLDYVLDRQQQVNVIEINPRPPATFELHERGRSLFSAHIQACHGELPEQNPAHDDHVHAYIILYARQTLYIPAQMKWPSWTSDRPRPGRKISFAEPVCTITASGQEQAKIKKLLYDRRLVVEAELLRWQDAA
ncbi:MAG: hypothetical protein A2W28_02885 [Gammaproteobacteria bacterium RBG_16_51_14]|nr:MAG: hypothetical protein A2W28_02885 [Gammaproteobacteria bacterium RBG_16_51_14]